MKIMYTAVLCSYARMLVCQYLEVVVLMFWYNLK